MKTITKKLDAAFKTISQEKKAKKLAIEDKQGLPIVVIKNKKTDQTHLVLGVRTFGSKNKKVVKKNTTLRLIDAILGGGMSSRLWQKLREEMGVGYMVRANTDEFTDHGHFNIYVGADNNRVVEVIKAVIEECNRLKTNHVSDSELTKAKDFLIGNTYLSLESSDNVAEFFAIQDIVGEPLETPTTFAKRIKEVTAKDIQKLAREIFCDDRLVLAIIGNISDDKEIKKVCRF